MAKEKISIDQYIAELNRRLPDDVRVFLYPEGSTAQTARGIDWTNKDRLDAAALVALAEEKVSALYEPVPPLPHAQG